MDALAGSPLIQRLNEVSPGRVVLKRSEEGLEKRTTPPAVLYGGL